MFVQGGLCFFCKQPLPKDEASVEHLFAAANGGSSKDENCVACCKSINALLGSMSLKEKFQVVLNQKGRFKCPNGNRAEVPIPPKVNPQQAPCAPSATANFDKVVANLKNRQNTKPKTIEALSSTIRSTFEPDLDDPEIARLIQQLQSSGKIWFSGNKVSYAL